MAPPPGAPPGAPPGKKGPPGGPPQRRGSAAAAYRLEQQALAQRKAQAAGAKPKRVEAVINGMLMGMGVALGILGSYVSLRG